MILYRHVAIGRPFLWESSTQHGARWHQEGERPVHYFADTPDGAWAEFLRQLDVNDIEEIQFLRRDIWAINVEVEPEDVRRIPRSTLTGDKSTYRQCQAIAKEFRQR